MKTIQTEDFVMVQTPRTSKTKHTEVILLAEDDLEMRRLLEQRFRRDGYEVETCRDGFELLQNIYPFSNEGSALKYDIIVSDIRMPGFTGMEILDYVHSSGDGPPIILITAFGDDETRVRAEQLNAVAILNKPFDLDELAEVVRRALDAPRNHSFRPQSPFENSSDANQVPLEIIFHRYPRLHDLEMNVREAARVLAPFESEILSCRIVIVGSSRDSYSELLEICGIVVARSTVFAVRSSRLRNEETMNTRAAVDRFFAVLTARMSEYYGKVGHPGVYSERRGGTIIRPGSSEE